MGVLQTLWYIFAISVIVLTGIILLGFFIFYYYKYFGRVNRVIIKVVYITIVYGSGICVLIVIIFLCVVFFLPKSYDSFIIERYKYLISPKQFLWRSRILDHKTHNDTIPKIKYVWDSHEIQTILKDRDFIEEMLRGLTENDYPCVFSYHVLKKDEVNNPLPHFMILNRKFDVWNDLGKNTKTLTEKLNIDKSILTRFILNTVGVMEYQGPFYFIFNANITGGSMYASEQIVKYTSMYRWDKNLDFLDFKTTIQIECIHAFFYNNEIIIEPTHFTFMGKLAYCVQDFLGDINKEEEEKKEEEDELILPPTMIEN